MARREELAKAAQVNAHYISDAKYLQRHAGNAGQGSRWFAEHADGA
jgi:hypothetical protein